jgi:hypothetical protein
MSRENMHLMYMAVFMSEAIACIPGNHRTTSKGHLCRDLTLCVEKPGCGSKKGENKNWSQGVP